MQAAGNAQLTVNGVPVTSTSNVVGDVIPGVTLTLRRKDPDATIVVDVARDHEASVERVEAFATAYNAVLAFMQEQNAAAANGRAAIGRDPLVRGLRDSLRNAMLTPEGGGTYTYLAEVGVTFDSSGKVKIDRQRLTTALETGPDAVRQLFQGRFEALGSLISSYTASGGLVADARDRISAQVARLGSRLETLEAQLALRRASLQREFIAADRAMSQLNNQGSSLTQLGGQYRLF